MVFVIEFSYIDVIIFVYRREVLIVQSNNTYLLLWIPKFNYWLLNTFNSSRLCVVIINNDRSNTSLNCYVTA